ncbi:hypothetical protein EC991_002037 [Linnemannia zychae]|nr:hypothetical protein EC991_002037 [Linnemannia zychae]
MYIVRWYTQRICVLFTATVFVALWLFFGRNSQLSHIHTNQIDNALYQEDGTGGGDTGDNDVMYEEDFHSDVEDTNDPEDKGNDGMYGVNAADEETDNTVLETNDRRRQSLKRELDDGQEDPTYYPGELRVRREMPSWFPDWVTNPNNPTAAVVGEGTDSGSDTATTIGDNSSSDNNGDQEPSANTSDSSTTDKTTTTSSPPPKKKHRPPRPAELDLVYGWVNGSDPAWHYSKYRYAQQEPVLRKINSNRAEAKMEYRFRDNDELLYSVRSIFEYGKDIVRKIFVVTADSIEQRLWDAMEKDEEVVEEEEEKESKMGAAETFVFDRERSADDVEKTWLTEEEEEARGIAEMEFLRKVDNFTVTDPDELIRPFIPIKAGPGEESGQFLYLNDDVFFGMPVSQADFWTPQYGFVFQPMLHMRMTPFPTNVSGENPLNRGYDENIQYANLQLSRRFGFRYRSFIAHIGHVASRSILQEAESLWPGAFYQSEKSRFRFNYDGHGLQTMFLMAHYTIERLRETQLRSFWRYRIDYNGNGVLEWEERWALFALTRDWARGGGIVNVQRMRVNPQSVPHFVTNNKDILHRTGYRDADQPSGISYEVSGMDGSPHLIPFANTSESIATAININNNTRKTVGSYDSFGVPPVDKGCYFDLDFCLGRKFMTRHGTLSHEDGEEVFKRLAFKEYHCGDCLLQIALQSDRGVEHYLERVEDAEDDDWGNQVYFMPPVDSRTGQPIRRPLQKQRRPDQMILLRPHFRKELDDVEYDLRRLHNKDKITNNNIRNRRSTRKTRKTRKTKRRYSIHTRGISAILPSSTTSPKARLRILQDLYQYNYVFGKSDFVFKVYDSLHSAKRIIATMNDDRWWKKQHHMVSLNEGLFSDSEESANGDEIRRLVKKFMQDWFDQPSPWEKTQCAEDEGGERKNEEEKEGAEDNK